MAADYSTLGPLAVIDVGVHVVRLQISQFRDDGTLNTIEQLTQPVPLGSDIYGPNQLSAANTRLIGDIVRDFAKLMRDYGVTKYKAVVTGAVREATNLDIFLHRVFQISGVPLEVLEEPEEIRLIFMAIKEALAGRFNIGNRNTVICMIGPDVSQILFLEKGHLHVTETVRLGTLRLRHELGGPVSPQKLREMIDPFVAAVVNGITRLSVGARPEVFMATGSSVRALVELGRKTAHKEDVAQMSRQRFRQRFKQISGQPVAQLTTRFALPDTTAMSLEPCCNMLDHFFEITAADRLIVPMISTRDALIQDFLREVTGGADAFIPEILSAAEHLGQKYGYDASHARSVLDNAVLLFDALQELHGLSVRHRLLLQVAALLHDIGFFVSSRQHHKHSYYLIRNSEIAGISPHEQELLALVARYHRRATPRPAHPEYMVLPPDQRVVVSKIAAILRVADALDRSHLERVRLAGCELTSDRLILRVKGPDDLTLERLGMQRKADLFKELFGLNVTVAG